MGRVFFILTTLSLMLALLTNRAPSAASALLTSAESGVSLMLTLLGTMTLWSGLMEVLLRTGDVAKLGLLIRKLFGRHSRALPDADCWEAVGMNLAANVLGLGNAATPPGVSAAKQLAAHGEPGLRVLALLLVLNNSGLQVLPTTVLTLRQAAGAQHPADIWGAMLISSAAATAAGVILLGALLLMLPLSTTAGCVTPFHEALFTATSAVCVTGLVVQDTGSYWSVFGQAVILTLIQIGGLGVVTVAASFALLSGRRISLMQRSTMQDAISAPKVGGIVRLTRFILRGTFLIELIGALAMLPVFCRDYGWRGIWMAVFHSISAFCNAGFDILGTNNSLYPSLTGYVQNPVINITVMLLIITGGIGFLTWDDICENKLHFHRYRMQSKVILVTTLALIVLPALFFFFVDFDALPLGKRVQAALFQSVTPRTAGFNTVDLPAMSGASLGVMILLMLIGGSPGSTAGGMKTTTLAVLLANAAATFRQRDSAQFFGRRVDCSAVKTAATILTMYLALFFGGGVFISVYEDLPLSSCLYEAASAVGTVGLTLGITPQLHIPSQMVLIALMYLGRVGGLTLIYAAVSSKKTGSAKLPQESITIG